MKKQKDIKLTKGLILLMAITSGLAIANIIYNQPLLEHIARYFNISRNHIGLVTTFTQIGYGCGMLFLIPLGDIKERKSLILKTLSLSIFSLIMISISMNFYWLLLASFLLGFSSIITQLLVPFVANIARPDERGKVIGTIISGMMTGIILARLVSGFVGPRLGWRAIYIMATVLITILTLTLMKLMPRCEPKSDETYGHIMKSMVGIIKTNPVVRSSSIIGPCLFAAVQLFWTSIVFYLESPVYGFLENSSEISGRFALVGIVGVFLVPFMGSLCDKKSPRFAIGLSISFAFLAYVIFYLFGTSLVGLTLGIMILDFAVNSSQVSNQARINSVDSPMQNRFNSVFMSIYFFIGSIGSYLGSFIYNNFAWTGICIAGFGFILLAALAHLTIGKEDYVVE